MSLYDMDCEGWPADALMKFSLVGATGKAS